MITKLLHHHPHEIKLLFKDNLILQNFMFCYFSVRVIAHLNRFSQPFCERFVVSSFSVILESKTQIRRSYFNSTLTTLTIEGNSEVTLALEDYCVKRS